MKKLCFISLALLVSLALAGTVMARKEIESSKTAKLPKNLCFILDSEGPVFFSLIINRGGKANIMGEKVRLQKIEGIMAGPGRYPIPVIGSGYVIPEEGGILIFTLNGSSIDKGVATINVSGEYAIKYKEGFAGARVDYGEGGFEDGSEMYVFDCKDGPDNETMIPDNALSLIK